MKSVKKNDESLALDNVRVRHPVERGAKNITAHTTTQTKRLPYGIEEQSAAASKPKNPTLNPAGARALRAQQVPAFIFTCSLQPRTLP